MEEQGEITRGGEGGREVKRSEKQHEREREGGKEREIKIGEKWKQHGQVK